MAIAKVDKIWMNGTLVNWDDARIHVLSHVVHYGSSWFEGIRCYNTAKGPAIFRLDRHIRRLFESAKIYRTEIPFTQKEIEQGVIDTIRANRMTACYIRPVVYRGYGEMGVNPTPCPVEVSIAVWEWGTYLGAEALGKGIDVCVSTWSRPAPNTLPTMAKAGGNYILSQLMKMDALHNGYQEAVALDVHGYVSEGSGENIFLVKDGILYTPTLANALLPGITRDAIITFARDMKVEVREAQVPREMLYVADEIFFTGTAAELTPIRSVDHVPVGNGEPGPVTKRLQKAFFEVVNEGKDKHRWMTFVNRKR